MSEKQDRIRFNLRKLVSALLIVGIIFVLPTVFASIATILAITIVLIIIWQKITEIWGRQEIIGQKIEHILSILRGKNV